jgi:hypothetical protein
VIAVTCEPTDFLIDLFGFYSFIAALSLQVFARLINNLCSSCPIVIWGFQENRPLSAPSGRIANNSSGANKYYTGISPSSQARNPCVFVSNYMSSPQIGNAHGQYIVRKHRRTEAEFY